MAARGLQITVDTDPTLIFEMVDSTTYAENGYTPADNPNIFIAGTAGDPLPILLLFTTADSVYLGGSDVDDTGALITGVSSLAYNAEGGDSLYGMVASSTSSISILALRQD